MLVRELASLLLTPVDLVLSRRERRVLEEPLGQTGRFPTVLIVGPPRSGTTLVYQTLAHYLPFTYFNNLSSLFPRSPITACRLFKSLTHSRKFDPDSYYGNTAGLAAPNDGFHVWNRWLGQDRYHAPSQLTSEQSESMRAFFAVWIDAFERPLLK